MTRSTQQPPTSPRALAESGSDGETAATAATAVAAAELQPIPEPEPAETRSTAESGSDAAEAEKKATQSEITEPDPETEGVSVTTSTSEDPSGAAAAKSRLPALVRTMTMTAINRPPQQAGPVGRPGKTALAGAAVAGALLVSMPFLVLGGDDDKDREESVAAGTVLGENSQEAPGKFVATTPDTGSSADGKKAPGKPKKPKPVREAPTSAPSEGETKVKKDRNDTGQEEQPKKQNSEIQPAKAGSGVRLSAPVSLRSHLSGRCIDVPGAEFSDGKKLFMWDCNNGVAQKWQFASDGTVRIQGLCLDVANANYNDGTPIQIARCSGNAAQKFVLNERHDLVNTVVGKCVDIKDNNMGNGAWLQLWTCAGTDNQKWSV